MVVFVEALFEVPFPSISREVASVNGFYDHICCFKLHLAKGPTPMVLDPTGKSCVCNRKKRERERESVCVCARYKERET